MSPLNPPICCSLAGAVVRVGVVPPGQRALEPEAGVAAAVSPAAGPETGAGRQAAAGGQWRPSLTVQCYLVSKHKRASTMSIAYEE